MILCSKLIRLDSMRENFSGFANTYPCKKTEKPTSVPPIRGAQQISGNSKAKLAEEPKLKT